VNRWPNEISISKRCLHSHVYHGTIHSIATIQNQPSADAWIKMWNMFTLEYYPATKKITNNILSFAATWMKLEDISLCKIGQHRKTNATFSYSYMEAKNIDLREESEITIG
jgi:hypothetical protein